MEILVGGRAGPFNAEDGMSIEYSLSAAPFDPRFVQALAALNESVFAAPKPDLDWRLGHMPMASVACASVAGRLLGFKAGYAVSRTRYYSWLGGVHADGRSCRDRAASGSRRHDLWRRAGAGAGRRCRQ